MSAAANAAGYLFASGHIAQRKERRLQEARQPQLQVVETAYPLMPIISKREVKVSYRTRKTLDHQLIESGNGKPK